MTRKALDKRDKYLRRTYGISSATYDAMLHQQDGRCAICRRTPKPGKRLHVDHCHKTNRVRGLLDWFCNHKFLGRRRENPDHHEAAAAYLRNGYDWREYDTREDLEKQIWERKSPAKVRLRRRKRTKRHGPARESN